MVVSEGLMETVLIVAIFSRMEEAFLWARQRIEDRWGSIRLESPRFDFDETSYYTEAMGSQLKKQFWLVNGLYDPMQLSEHKRESGLWEQEYAKLFPSEVVRPLNLDPGYVTLNKLVLASTKDRAHRIYIGQGVFAEVTMRYVGGWQYYPWTYPDYQRPLSNDFFTACRKQLNALRSQAKHQ